MAMQPSRSKYRKVHRGKIRGRASRANKVSFGDFGLQSLDAAWLSGRQIEAGRVAINRALDGQGKVWIRVFPHKPVSGKPAETRMGKGKGEVEFWAAVIKPGSVIFEVGGIPEDKAKLAFKRAAHKMPVKVKLIRRLATT
ncbi:MAG: 50S ribosomal protein L16 [Planctomycetota bacterium]|nr:50S ribosomal protein L16 [Planctomycetota bacterium]